MKLPPVGIELTTDHHIDANFVQKCQICVIYGNLDYLRWSPNKIQNTEVKQNCNLKLSLTWGTDIDARYIEMIDLQMQKLSVQGGIM